MYGNYPNYTQNEAGQWVSMSNPTIVIGEKKAMERKARADREAEREKLYAAQIPAYVQDSRGNVYKTDKAGNAILGTASGGRNIVSSGSGYTPYAAPEAKTEEPTIESLLMQINDLKRWVSEQEVKNQIQVDGSFDGTNIPVRVNGVRRKIATVAP